MRDRQSTPDTKSHHSQPTKERETQRTTAQQEDLVTQQNPLTQTISRMGSAPSAKVHANLLSRATSDHPARSRQLMLQMQRQYGNRYVQRVVELSRQGAGEAEATPEVEAAIQRKRGGGQALDNRVQAQMESAFGTDLSRVRVHTDGEADGLNRALSARAFTTGQDIFFRQGEYSPGSSSARELLAHELTHVVQQTEKVQPKLTIGEPGDKYEQEADRVAQQVLRMPETSLQRQVILGGNATSITTSNLSGPEWKNNGQFKWWINWATDGTSGWIVQKIENTYSGTRADGTPITNASVGVTPLYYEAWEVATTGTITGSLGRTGNRDRWERPNLGSLGSQTSFSMKGTVYWTSTDPASSGFTSPGVANAGSLLSSTSAPAGIGSPLLVRGAHGTWFSDGTPALPGCFIS